MAGKQKLPCGHSLVSGRCDSALCWSTYRSAVAGGGDAALVVAPLAAVGVGRAAGAVREAVAPLVHRGWRERTMTEG